MFKIDPSLAQTIEDVVLFGKPVDLENMLDQMTEADQLPEDLRYGLESLRIFRAHYAAEATQLSEANRQKVIQYDADWTMQIIQKIHSQHFGMAEEKIA